MASELIQDPTNIPRYWQDLPHQNQALQWLWDQLSEHIQREFTKRWRDAPPAPVAPAVDPYEGKTVIGWENTDPAFRNKTAQVAERLGIKPLWLLACMSFETGGTFSPSIRNAAGSGATGLIQFMPATAVGLGTTTQALATMDRLQQLDWVEKYFQPYKGRMRGLHDVYMAILWPAAVGRGPEFILFRSGGIAYRQNAGLDWNQDGQITAGEASAKVAARIK